MGKVQKKANEKHKLSLSPALTEFIDKTIALPLAQLPSHLATFPKRWPFPRGDLYNWIEPLDRFDEVLQKFNKTYGLNDGLQSKPFGTAIIIEGSPGISSDQLAELGFEDDGDRVLVQSILSFSRLLLEKCGNRTLYNSTERLNDLLNTISLPLLNETLLLTLVLAQRFAERSPQPQGHAQFHHFDISKLLKLATPVPRSISRKAPLSPVKSPKAKDKSSQPKLRRAPTTADPNDFRALARQSVASQSTEGDQSRSNGQFEELDWTAVAMVKVAWPAPTTPSRPTSSRNASFDVAVSPTPVRHQQGLGLSVSTSGSPSKLRQTESTEQSGLQEIELAASDLRAMTIEQVLQNAPESMPTATRYELLHKLRIAYGLLDSARSRNLLLETRLAALSIISQVLGEDELKTKYFDGDSNASVRRQLVQQLTGLLRESRSGQTAPSLTVQSLAMEALIALSRYRQMSSEIMSAMSGNSSHGLLISLVQRGLADIAQDGDATDNEAGDDWRHGIFTLWMIFINQSNPTSSRTTEQYVHKNLISAYASALQIITRKSLRVHFFVLKFLELLFHQFRDGLQVLNANGAFAIACDTTDKLCTQALELYNSGQGIPEQWKTPGVDFKIPYPQQFVLRELVVLVKDVSKYQGNHADRALRSFVDSSSLLQAFRLVLSHMDAFGAHTWSEVVIAVCGFLNNEPTSYTVVSEAGIISTLLDTVQPAASSQTPDNERTPKSISDRPSETSLKLPAITDAISNLASAFGAICLTEAGLNRFIASNVLETFFQVFESPAHLKAMKDSNAPIQLGSTFDELVRHHPKLKELVLSSVITMIARVRHICRFRMKETGAGPKIWVKGPDGPAVDGGTDALITEDIPHHHGNQADFQSLKLPNGDSIEFDHVMERLPASLTTSAQEEDNHGLTTLDYARPAMGFLSAFLENHFLCKELLNAETTDLILDFVTLPTLPVVEESFSEGLFMQDLITVMHLVSNDRPYLVLSLLIDRARYICNDVLRDFINFKPDGLQCYFGRALFTDTESSAMDIDMPTAANNTKTVRALMSVYGITRVLAEVFLAQTFHSRPHHASVLLQLNVTDILAELTKLLGQLSASCCREEMTLLAKMPEAWTAATRPPNYSTGDPSMDAILGFSNKKAPDASDKAEPNVPDPEETTKENKDNAAFRNLKTLRYLLAEIPAAVSTMFSRIGSSFNGKARKIETINRQKIVEISNAIAEALTLQLEPAFMPTAFKCDDVVLEKDTRFKYLGVILVRLRDSLWEDNSSVPSSSIRQSFIVECFRKFRGFEMLSKIGRSFFEELKSCQVDSTVCAALAANAGLKICLDLFVDFTHSDLVSSHQSSYMRYLDHIKDFYFNPYQLLLELRMSSLPLARAIWDSEYAEQASNDIVRDLTNILKHTLSGENEEGVISRADDYPKLKDHDRRRYEFDSAKVSSLKEKGFEQSLAEEALYRCNVVTSANHNQVSQAEDYCRAVRDNPRRRRLYIPEGEVRYRGDASASQIATPSNAMSATAGPTATIVEDRSQDDDVGEAIDINSADDSTATMSVDQARQDSSTSSARQETTAASTMSISNILSSEQPVQPIEPVVSCFSRETIDAERESIRETLAERCNNILSSHPSLIFEVNDLIVAGAAKPNEEAARAWWEATTDLLVMSLLSQNVEDDIDEAQGKKIAANAHLIGLLCSNDKFKPSMLKVLQSSIDDIIGFLKIPAQKSSDNDSSPWIGPVLLILEKLLALDAEPSEINFHVPSDLDSYQEPKFTHTSIVEHSSKVLLFQRLMEILPRNGKDRHMALAIVRVLVILTRDRSLSQMQSERKNLQKLFLMMKQLSGLANSRLEGAFLSILRHVVEDDATVKQIMISEITFYFRSRAPQRSVDLGGYLRELNHLALRSPALFVQASNETVKLAQWVPGNSAEPSVLALREHETERETVVEPSSNNEPGGSAETAAPSIEATSDAKLDDTKLDDAKLQEQKIPIIEHPDGIVHFLLSELLRYKDVEDKETSSDEKLRTSTEGADTANKSEADQAEPSDATSDMPEKPRYKAEEHPIFVYRCFLLHCLTELLYSYNKTKIEFISFSRKADPLAATPSKARSGVLTYLLSSLVSSGYVDKDDSIACRKRLVTSDWAMKAIVALCSKTGEQGLAATPGSRYSSPHRHVDDNDSEPDISYVRRFVLDHAIKAFKDAISSTDSIQTRYGRLLCLSDLFNKLISRPTGPEGSVFSANNSYKRVARIMLEKNFIATLTSAISDIDLSFPGAKRVVKFILKPLKELTATATDLSINAPDQFPAIIDQAGAESISSASSEVSELEDDDREETPDLYRNSALGMLDRAHQEESDTEEDDEDDEMDYDEYDEEMDYDEDVPAPINDGEVISDEELEDVMDGAGPLEGLPGDVPMEIEYVVDHHHHDDDDDDETNSEDEDEDEDEDEEESDDDLDDGDDIEIEVEDDHDVDHDQEAEGHSDDDGEDSWEDDEGEDAQPEDDDDDLVADDDLPIDEDVRTGAAHLNNLLRALGEPDPDSGDLPPAGELVTQLNDAYDEHDEDDQDEDDEDMDENEGLDHDQPFDMMLDGPDFDENEEWGWEEPSPPVFRRSRHSRAAGMPPFFTRRVVNMGDAHEMMHHMMGTRHFRRAAPTRGTPEDGQNPLLQRPEPVTPITTSSRTFVAGIPGGSLTRGIPMMISGDGLPPMPITIDGGLGGITGHGNILDAIMGAIQRGEPRVMQDGRLQLNLTATAPSGEPLEFLTGGPGSPFSSRQPKEDPYRSASFTPLLTVSRWQEEARIIFGKILLAKVRPILTWVFATLIPAAQTEARKREEEKKRLEVERKAEAEREAQRRAEEERIKKEEEERLAKEKAEAEERARLEAEARAAEESAGDVTQEAETDDAMEGVQTSTEDQEAPAAVTEEPVRTYTTIRGRQLDITGLDIDAEYLEALPEELREEVITAQYQVRRQQAQEQGNEDSAIDQDFLDALPEDIREEIRAQEAAAVRRRERRREAQAGGGAGLPGEMDADDFLASLDPALRRVILAEQTPEILSGLAPQHAAEGRAQARSMFLHHRLPIQRDLDVLRDRREQAQRDAKRQQLVQLIDKAGVATLLRLMFVHQQGSLRQNLQSILSQVCGNRQTRFEVVSLILVILKEGSADVSAIERSLASLSLRAKATGAQKTPQPLKRTLSMQQYAGLADDVTPMLVVQQCLGMLKHICEQNVHVKSLFLREVDVTSSNKVRGKAKGKSKEAKTTTHPVNDLISLLDRKLIMDNAGCLLSIASLLSTVTSPLASLMRQEKERQETERKAKEDAAKAKEEGDQQDQSEGAAADVTMNDPTDASKPESSSIQQTDAEAGDVEEKDAPQSPEQEKKRPFEPPNVTDHNLKLITNIFVAPECGNDTFRYTIATLQSLSHIPATSQKFSKELTRHVHALSQTICGDLDELLPAIEDAQSSTDVQGAAAAKFSASASDQVKLLRVLQALDYLAAPKKDEGSSSEATKSILVLSYESLGLGPLWRRLSSCLSAVEEKGDTISFANILLPLIESLMVVCKHTTLKDTPVQVKEATVTSPIATSYRDDLEELFFNFTSDHRKILNDIVRQSPKLMQGHFAILVKNSKVLDFDNKRNYFAKQIHSRHHAQRHPQPPLQLNVRRDQVFIDSYKALYYKNAEEMKYGKLNIRFNGEEGVDAGGVTREWFQVLARGMFDPNYALFQPVASDKTTFHPSPLSRVNEEHLMYFKFIGRIIGKALHEGRVLDCHFSRAVYKRILGKKPNLKDLESNDVDYYKSLVWILENDITDILTEEFCVIEDEFGEEKVIDLIPDGRNISVTEENKKEYVQSLVEYRLTESVKEQLDSFLGGFHDIIPAELISIFNEQELELLISGLPEIDVDDWKANTEYHNYNPSSQQIVWFWRIVKAMTNEERAKLLQFITGTSKVPLNGFKELEGVSGLTKCNIHKDPSTNRLPTSHTCFNQLDIPAYESFEIMKQNLFTAINLGADYFGFA